MFNLLIINFLQIIFFIYLVKKVLSNIYLVVIISYFLIIIINFSLFVFKQEINLDLIWLNFSIITFLFTIYAWVYGVITKSVSLKILVYLSEKKRIYKVRELTNKIVHKEFNKRIRILKENKLINFHGGFFEINKNGIKKMNVILKLRKFYNIHKKNFYF